MTKNQPPPAHWVWWCSREGEGGGLWDHDALRLDCRAGWRFLVQRPGQSLRDLSTRIRQGNSAGVVALQPASFGSERHSPVGGAIEPPDGSPLQRISVGRFMKQPYQRKSHCLGLVGH